MKKNSALVLLLICVAVSYGQMNRDPNLSEGDGPVFRCRVGQLLGESPDSVRLLVVAALPYDNLQFVRGDSGFVATFELVSSVYDSNDALVSEKIANRIAFTRTYRETNLQTRAIIHKDFFNVTPGDYRVRVVLIEKESNGQSRFETMATVNSPDSLLRVSDVFWTGNDSAAQGFDALQIVRGFFTDEAFAIARFQIASTGADSIYLNWRLLGSNPEDVFQTHELQIAPSQEPTLHELRLSLQEVGAGDYTLYISAEGNGRQVARELPFTLTLRGLPKSIVQLDVAIRQLRYVATGSEMRRLRDAPPLRREALFRDFWKRRDPSPGTEQNELMQEYYYRVEYANTHFSTNRNGWETDRGRIFILYGEPSDIEQHPFEINSKPYEVWYYNALNRRFVFVDYTGFGDYELVEPEWWQ